MASGTRLRLLPRSSTTVGRTGGVSRISAGRCRSTTCLQCRPGGARCCQGCTPLEARRRALRPPAPMAASQARSWCLPAATTSTRRRRRWRMGYAEGRRYQVWFHWCGALLVQVKSTGSTCMQHIGYGYFWSRWMKFLLLFRASLVDI